MKKYRISIWGKWETLPRSAPEDFLWHAEVEILPEAGSVLSVIGSIFQIETIEPSADEDGALHILNVRPYNGTNVPALRFGDAADH